MSLGPQAGVNHKKTNKCNIYEGGRLKKEGFEDDSQKSLFKLKVEANGESVENSL